MAKVRSFELDFSHGSRPEPDVEALIEGAIGSVCSITIHWPSCCSGTCSFCVQTLEPMGDQTAREEQALAWLDEILATLEPVREGASGVRFVLSGNDPFSASRLSELLLRLRRFGTPEGLEVVGPPDRLADPAFVGALVDQGVTAVHTTAFGADSAGHDPVAGRDGAFDDLAAALSNLRDADLEHVLLVVVVRDSLARLADTLSYAYRQTGRVRVHFYWAESAPIEFARRNYVPHSDLAAALDRHRMTVERTVLYLDDVPVCTLPKWAQIYANPVGGGGSSRAAADLEACRACRLHGSRCRGVEPEYVEVFGDDDFRPL